MTNKRQLFLKKIFIWRVKHLTDRQFILILSGILGIASGIAALAMRSFTLFIQWRLEGTLV